MSSGDGVPVNVRTVYLDLSNVYELLGETCPKIQDASIRSSLQAEEGSVVLRLYLCLFFVEFARVFSISKPAQGG